MAGLDVPLEKVRLRLESVRTLLTPTERKLASFILQHADDVIHQTISELAAAAQVSIATVTRLAQNSGYSGYTQLRVLLAKDLTLLPVSSLDSELQVSDEVSAIRDKLVLATCNSLQDTQKMNRCGGAAGGGEDDCRGGAHRYLRYRRECHRGD